MGRVVYCPLPKLSVTIDADQDIWELAAPAGNKLKLLGWEVSSAKTTAEAISLRLLFGTATGNGSAGTVVNADNGDDATIVGAVDTLALAPGTDGGIIQTFQWEQLGPLGQVYTPEMAPVVDVSTFIKLNLETALSGTTVWDGWLCWEEI